MAKYIYQRYLVRTTYSEKLVNDLVGLGNFFTERGYENYTLNSSTGLFVASGSYTAVPSTGEDRYRVGANESDVVNPPGGVTEGKMILKFRRTGTTAGGETFEVLTSYSRGTYIDEIVAEEGVYPVNGRQGSYWYVRGERYAPFPQIKVAGEMKEPVEGFVMVNGTLRQIVESLIKENGEWKTLV